MIADGSIDPEKVYALDFVERNRDALALIADSIFYFAELGGQEVRSSGLMAGQLEAHGFTVTRGISGFSTAFLATYGSGEPVIALHTEYDANPSNSQRSGVTVADEIVPGAPGHCEGHNVNAAVLVSAALAVRYAMERFGLRGTIKVFGAPAEELLLSRPYFVRDGYFDDVDVAFHDHISGDFRTAYGLMQAALVSATFTFHGESAHAGTWPWKGRDALDAVMLMDAGFAQYREHMEPTMRAHRVVTNGGEQPNVIPAKAAIWWYFRDPSAEGARKLFEQAKKIAQGAALMTNTEVGVELHSAVWPTRGNQTLAEIAQRNIEAIGVPAWTDDEERFARELQRSAKVKDVGLLTAPTALKGPSVQQSSSNDSGDVTWKVPSARIFFPANVPNLAYHHWTAGAALATSIAHKGGVAGAKAMAATVIDVLHDPSIVTRAHETFKSELGELSYRSLLPPDQRPPDHLNEAVMTKWRPLMESTYLAATPHFTP
jgi:aminobenzoyl-glutamate utilization protein B